MLLTADGKGAMVIGPDRLHFEFVGEVPSVFRASAWCGSAQHSEPYPGIPVWPIEVCGAALEEPGLTEALLRTADDAPPEPPGAAPSASP